MAKSIRSKSKLRAKSLKRKGEFGNHVDSRNKRLSDKMEVEMKKQKDAILAAKKANNDGEAEVEESKEEMEVDSLEPKKVSTSGWRDSRKQIYKKTNIKRKKNKSTNY